MRVFLNGRILPAEEALVPISDRGLLYGDGLFETLRVHAGRPCFWERHLARLNEGAAFLRIPLPYSREALWEAAQQLLRENEVEAGEAGDAVLRITLTRGVGARGYSPRGAGLPTLALTVHPRAAPPAAVTLRTASLRVASGDGLSRFKTANKLVSVLARVEAEDNGTDEALLLNTDGHVAEAAASNIYWINGGRIHTPPLAAGALGGVLRAVLLEFGLREGKPVAEQLAEPAELQASEGVFLTNSTQGLVPVSRWDGRVVAQSRLVGELRQRLEDESCRSASGA